MSGKNSTVRPTFAFPPELCASAVNRYLDSSNVASDVIHRMLHSMEVHGLALQLPLSSITRMSPVSRQSQEDRRPFELNYDGPFRVVPRATNAFRIQNGTREEVMSADHLKAAVWDTPPEKACGNLPSVPPPSPPSIPPSRILPLPPCPHPSTATIPSSTTSTQATRSTHSSNVPPV
ncbi:unnamed protein product [Schistocephalus solidus]|uniref:Uncharacterized protein n=1 Tax=Schistocephalus solidus TaxID=70667 RepID=A0A183T305_SCHSO|nr:unnamed protein product [Schistocephalus solidus]